ncbi:LysR family transcriptional regulator [Dickeya solani]|uniref:LysR family transcriptional regulator n=2 Tax=Dickeya solani TaxID=1089444 RepID=UPI001FCC9B5D|nr:LysR family transcriptional regulator [Dickeya solani]
MNEINISSLDLNLLKTFEALYEEGSASRAGLRLGITQSAVSAALKRLKQWYGDPLFVRTGRGLMPTPRAHELQPLVSDALNKCRETLTLLQPNPQAYAGRTVTLGLSDDFELALGQTLIARLQQRAPGLRLVFRQAHSQIAADLLLRHELDLALTAGGFSYRSLSKVQVASGGYACLVARDVTALSLERFIQTPHLLISHGGHIGLVDETAGGTGGSAGVLPFPPPISPRFPGCCRMTPCWLRCPPTPLRPSRPARRICGAYRAHCPCRITPSNWDSGRPSSVTARFVWCVKRSANWRASFNGSRLHALYLNGDSRRLDPRIIRLCARFCTLSPALITLGGMTAARLITASKPE